MTQNLQMGFFTEPPIVPPELGELPEKIGRKPITYKDARGILNKATGFTDGYDFTLNPASGCVYACVYCYAPSFQRDPQAIDNWGEWVTVKQNAIELLVNKFPAGSLDGKRIYASTVTDPYQPFERKIRLTRGIFEVLAEHHKPKLVVQTRSPIVTRDIDLFKQIERNGGRVQVNMTVTTPPTPRGEEIRKAFEPECPSNAARLKAITEVQASGIQSCITMTPTLLIDDPHGFADILLETGVQRFITQPFHFEKTAFKAGTREKGLNVLTKILGCDSSRVIQAYMHHYNKARCVLVSRLPYVGEGKDGFKPPF